MAETKEARKKRLERSKKNMMTVKVDQVGVCRFASVTVQDFMVDTNGKYVRCGSHVENGLQYENFLVLPDGSFKYLNSSSVRIVRIYEGVPEWANGYLRDLHMSNYFYGNPIRIAKNGGVCYA